MKSTRTSMTIIITALFVMSLISTALAETVKVKTWTAWGTITGLKPGTETNEPQIKVSDFWVGRIWVNITLKTKIVSNDKTDPKIIDLKDVEVGDRAFMTYTEQEGRYEAKQIRVVKPKIETSEEKIDEKK